MVLPGRRNPEQKSVIDTDSPEEVYGVLLSQRRREGESNPTVPEEKVRNTKSIEAKRVPDTGIAKERKGK